VKVDIKGKMDKYWSLWTQLLKDSLKEKWDNIMSEQTYNKKGYVAMGGTCTARKRGKTIPAMKACICQWLLQVMEPNVAKHHHNYLSAQIKMPFRGYNCKAFAARVLQLNEYCKYLPYLKDEEGLPPNLKNLHVLFNDIKLYKVHVFFTRLHF